MKKAYIFFSVIIILVIAALSACSRAIDHSNAKLCYFSVKVNQPETILNRFRVEYLGLKTYPLKPQKISIVINGKKTSKFIARRRLPCYFIRITDYRNNKTTNYSSPINLLAPIFICNQKIIPLEIRKNSVDFLRAPLDTKIAKPKAPKARTKN